MANYLNMEKVLIERGCMSSVWEAAKGTSKKNEIMILSERDSEIFVEALLNPPAPSDKLQAAAKRYLQKMGR